MPTKPYDSAWKEAIELYFEAFMRLLFPDIHQEIDWSSGYQLLDKELRQISTDDDGKSVVGTRGREADALVQVARNDGQEIWVLVHVEVQTHRDSRFAERMYVYNYRIRDRYHKEVCSLAVLGDKSPKWRPSSYQAELWGSKIVFDFPTAKLLDFEPQLEQLERSVNPVALLVAAHLHALHTKPNSAARRHSKFRLVRNLFESGLGKNEIITFFRLVDWVLTLSPGHYRLFWSELKNYEMEKRMPYITSVERMGIEKGLKQGLEQGIVQGLEQGRKQGETSALRSALQTLLSARLGTIPESISGKLQSLDDPARLQSLVETAALCTTFEEFERAVP